MRSQRGLHTHLMSAHDLPPGYRPKTHWLTHTNTHPDTDLPTSPDPLPLQGRSQPPPRQPACHLQANSDAGFDQARMPPIATLPFTHSHTHTHSHTLKLTESPLKPSKNLRRTLKKAHVDTSRTSHQWNSFPPSKGSAWAPLKDPNKHIENRASQQGHRKRMHITHITHTTHQPPTATRSRP